MLMQPRDNRLHIIRHVTWVGFWINAMLMALKLAFGFYGHSDALIADGFHSLSDFGTDFIVLVLVGIAHKGADNDHPYGHGKFETIASVIISLILICVAAGITISGIRSIVGFAYGEPLLRPDIWTLVVAALSIVAKEWLYRYTMTNALAVESEALKANAWHHRSDALSSVAALAGIALSLFLGDKWTLADPITSLIIGLLIAYSAVKISIPSLGELMETSLPADVVNKIEHSIDNTAGVLYYHNLRTRRNGHSAIIDVNIHVNPRMSVAEGHAIASEVENNIRQLISGDAIIYVHVEPAD